MGYWTILPQDFLDIALITYFYQFVNFVIMVHIGTLFNLRELKSEWKVVVITLAAVVGIVITVYLLGQYIPWVGKAQALAWRRPLPGGLMAALIMGEAGNAAGMPGAGNLSSICFIMQGFVGFRSPPFPQERGHPRAGRDRQGLLGGGGEERGVRAEKGFG